MRFTYKFDGVLTILLEMHGESSAVLVDRMMEADGSCKASACRFPARLFPRPRNASAEPERVQQLNCGLCF